MSSENCAHSSGGRDGKFWSYVIPSMVSMLLAGFYSIVDGFFIGREMGDVGLSGVNIAWPVTSFLMALGTGIGVGGGVAFSHRLGKGDEESAERARGNAILLLCSAAVLLTVLLIRFIRPILLFLGAEGDIFTAALTYGKMIAIGAGMQIFGCGMAPLLRNAGKTTEAMGVMVAGLLINIVLDAFFIIGLRWDMFGAALATTIAQGLVALLCLLLLYHAQKGTWKRSGFRPDGALMRDIFKVGLSPFGLTYAPSIIIILTNWQCIRYGGAIALSTYTVLSYVLDTIQLSLQGIGDGIQPLVSYYNGAKRYEDMASIRRKAFRLTLALGVGGMIGAYLLRDMIPVLFGASAEASAEVSRYMWIFAVAFPLTGIVRLASSYFYAVQKTTFSTLLIYLDPLCFTPILLFTLPVLLGGMPGVWAATPAAQLILCVMAAAMFLRYSEKLKREIHQWEQGKTTEEKIS